jgi:hypothetical protein
MHVSRILLPLLSTIATSLGAAPSFGQALTIAQAGYVPCQPPNLQEYLLLVVSRAPDVQTRVRSVLPTTAETTVCLYRTDVVTRIGNFTTIEAANAWSKYMTDSLGVTAYVVKPSAVTAAPPSPRPTSTLPIPTLTTGYNPQSLGTGYAVLVNYFNHPAIAGEIKQLLNQEVGLVSYGQRPFLLALYTADITTANATLKRLSDRGYAAQVVDSQQLMLLRSAVQY